MTRRLVVALVSVLALAGCSSDKFDPSGGGGSDGGVESGTGGASGSSGSGATGGSAGQAGGGSAGQAGGGSGGTAGNPGGDPNGSACSDGSTCLSAKCVDDVCCDTTCDKECEACNVSGSEGTCTPYDKGTDPDTECLGGGTTSGPCSGSCDGASACEYPDTSCGSPTCTGGTQTNPTCDGNGVCGSAAVPCSPYVCGASTCKTSCSGDADCATGNWCNGSKCEPKKANGQSCGGNNQCTSNSCISGVCCNVSACASPASCSTGTCLCGGAACASGQSCVYWYQDSDNDTYGNAASKKPACSGTKPSGYVSDATDCYDNNANAKPGQTQFFTTHRGDNSYDYNCDNAASVQYPKIANMACGECKPAGGTGCVVGLCIGGFGCVGGCPSSGPGFGYDTDVACGQSADLKKCVDTNITPDCAPLKQSAGATTQGCR